MFRFIGKVILNVVVTLAVIAGLIFGVGYLINENSDAIGKAGSELAAQAKKDLGPGFNKVMDDLDERVHQENLRIISGDLTPDERRKMAEYERAYKNGSL